MPDGDRTPEEADIPLESALGDVGTTWEGLAKEDPLWAILVEPGKEGGQWDLDDFFERGRSEIAQVLGRAGELSLPLHLAGRALDFGCGAGRLTQGLAHHFANCDGVDVSPTMIDLAIKYNRFPAVCHYRVNVASDLRLFQNDQFDFIYSNCVLQHMAPLLALSYVKEFVRVLRPGGTVVFQVPDLLGGPKLGVLRVTHRAAALLAPRRRFRRLIGANVARQTGREMKMFTIPQAVVEETLAASGAQVRQVDFVARAERTFHGVWDGLARRWNIGFVSKTYFATK
jgi:SAM-dependent methyltransferase